MNFQIVFFYIIIIFLNYICLLRYKIVFFFLKNAVYIFYNSALHHQKIVLSKIIELKIHILNSNYKKNEVVKHIYIYLQLKEVTIEP